MTRTEAEARVAAVTAWWEISKRKAARQELAKLYPWLVPCAALLGAQPDDSPITAEQWLRAGLAFGVKPQDVADGKAGILIVDGRLALVRPGVDGVTSGPTMGPDA